MSNGPRTMDPPFTGKFVFAIDGMTIGAFTEVSGLSVEIETEDLVEGGNNHFVHKLPKGMKWPNLVFKRGITNADSLFEWFAECSGEGLAKKGNKIERRGGSIELKNAAGKTVRKWSFTGAMPVKWTGPSMAAGSSDLAVEELEVCHRGFAAEK